MRIACRALPLVALVLLQGEALAAARHAAPAAHTAAAEPGDDTADLAAFAHKAGLMRDIGATQMSVTDNLPIGTFENDPDDPYPAWFVHHASLLKIYPPAELKPFVPAAYALRVQHILAQRCAILARNGLKGVWNANEPAVLPEPFFVAHPAYRGPRIDQLNRSRKVYFSPNVDQPDVRRMYRDSVQALLAACPAVDTFLWVTTDAGSGFDWAPALYPGGNGASDAADTPLADRVVGFMQNIRQAAADTGHQVRVAINQIEPRQWMIPTFSPDVLANIVRQLPPGLAVNGREGPDGHPFESGMPKAANPFYPVVGLSVPSLTPQPAPGARRGYTLGDAESADFSYRLLKATNGVPMTSAVTRLAALRAFAVQEVGEGEADRLIELWRALGDVQTYLGTLEFGGMLRFGQVLNRWIARPMVPFPLELSTAEKAGYAPFLFQAKGPEQAANLADIQAMRMYEGWGAHLLFQHVVELAVPRARTARTIAEECAAAATDPAKRAYWALTAKRIQALLYLLQSADDMVAYQAHLDRVAQLGVRPDPNPVLGTQSDWARSEMTTLARREIDTTVALEALLGSTDAPLLDLAPTRSQESIMRLGPDLRAAMRDKVRIMNAHWRDYDRLFTMPNP